MASPCRAPKFGRRKPKPGWCARAAAGADGSFVLTNLPVGPYTLEVSKEGFSKYVQSGIVLQVGSNPNIDVALKVGSVTEQVQVEANASQVETRSTGVGQVIDNQRVLELPLNGGQATELIYQSGIATPVNGAGLEFRRAQLSDGEHFRGRRAFQRPGLCAGWREPQRSL